MNEEVLTAADNVASAAAALLVKIENLTTEEFQRGGERQERKALREALRTWFEKRINL